MSLFIFYILVWWCFFSGSVCCRYSYDCVKTYLEAALAEAEAAAAFTSFLALLSALAGLAGLASGVVAGTDAAGVEAAADADAAITFAAGADFATLAAAAEAAGAGLADAAALALAGVCANALPITTVEAMMAVISLFMICFPIGLGYLLLFLLIFLFRSQPT
jgi:hypothetical protein